MKHVYAMIWNRFLHNQSFVKKCKQCGALMFLWCQPERVVAQTVEMPLVWNTLMLKICHDNEIMHDLEEGET